MCCRFVVDSSIGGDVVFVYCCPIMSYCQMLWLPVVRLLLPPIILLPLPYATGQVTVFLVWESVYVYVYFNGVVFGVTY